MVERMYKKGVVVGIIVLLIGVGSQSVFAVEDKTSSESLTIDNENPNTKSIEIYENTNCFVVGIVRDAWNQVSDHKKICFGWAFGDPHPIDFPASGWIYTNGDNGKWIYSSANKGGFYGTLGTDSFVDWETESWITYYIGVTGFKRFAIGARDWGSYDMHTGFGTCFFFGNADHVGISSV